ncbi:MAG: hypothetical protein ACOZF0_10365 [Thermodesulfobacteriota bacterium]
MRGYESGRCGPEETRPADFKKNHPGFSIKIVLLVFSIMALSQTMGALFSALSFEEVYLSAMTSKFEILGRDLKRRIEQAVKFGKRLDRFVGIEKLTGPILRQAEDIEEIFIAGSDGRLLHTSKSSSLTSVAGNRLIDSALLKAIPSQTASAAGRLQFQDGRYFLLFPISAGYGEQDGFLGLSFSRTALNQKKHALLGRTFMNLGFSVVLTAAALLLLIEYGFSRPLIRWSRGLIRTAENTGRFMAGMDAGPAELRGLCEKMDSYVIQTASAREELLSAIDDIGATPHLPPHAEQAVLRMKQLLEEKSHDAD